MIIEHKGSIFDAPIDVIITQCNCFNTMGAGIALEIKKRFPQAYAADCKTRKGDRNKLGKFSFSRPAYEGDKYIINLYGQYNYGKSGIHTDYEALSKGFVRIKEWVKYEQEYQNMDTKLILGIPSGLGAGFGGGHWPVILQLIKNAFEKWENNILICSLE